MAKNKTPNNQRWVCVYRVVEAQRPFDDRDQRAELEKEITSMRDTIKAMEIEAEEMRKELERMRSRSETKNKTRKYERRCCCWLTAFWREKNNR